MRGLLQRFRLIAPTAAHLLHTINPTMAVGPDGHSTQVSDPAAVDRPYERPTETGHFAMHGGDQPLAIHVLSAAPPLQCDLVGASTVMERERQQKMTGWSTVNGQRSTARRGVRLHRRHRRGGPDRQVPYSCNPYG